MPKQPNPVIYSVPVEESPASDFALTVGGVPVFTHQARVSACPLNQVWPGYQRPLAQTELASFAAWDMTSPVEVVAVSARPVTTVRVRPRSAGITPRVDGNTIRFMITKPGQYTVEVNGMHHALHLFANPPEEGGPDSHNPRDSRVLYFGPGVHCPGLIRLTSGQTVYLAAGAVVYGAILAEKAEHVAVLGRGILDGSKFDRMDLTALICLHDCADVRIEGVILRDPPGFSMAPIASRDVHVRNVKLIGNWRYNTDGIDFISCHSCSVEDSFIRSFDDSICVKGYETFGPFIYRLQLAAGRWDGTFTMGGEESHPFADLQRRLGVYPCLDASIRDIQVRRCVLWNEWGRALEVGAETVADEIRDLVYEDCDIIHTGEVAMDVQNCDRALCRNIVFRDIRVEMDDGASHPVFQQHKDQVYEASQEPYLPNLIVLEIKKGYVSLDDIRGRIEDIRFEGIEVTAPGVPPSRLLGHDCDHRVQRVTIENLYLNGQVVTVLAAGRIAANEFVRGVTIRAKADDIAATAKRILFLGNSITFHGAKADIGWTGNWGMAASAQEKDYVHVLLRRLAAAAGGTVPEARIENIADFEREYAVCDIAKMFGTHAAFKADIVILAIGENVPVLATEQDKAAFRKAVAALLAIVVKGQSPALFVRGIFWADPVKDAVLRQVCRDAGGTFVDISHLGRDEANHARAERQLAHAGVAAHPGDAGMAAIADALWNAIHAWRN